MKTFLIYNYFELFSVDADSWHKGRHRHQFYELLYIEKGAGVHTLNANKHRYAQGDIYLLTPGDQHSFYTLEPTIFHCIRFLPEFFADNDPFAQEIFLKLKGLLISHNLVQGKISLKSADQEFMLVLIQRILADNRASANPNKAMLRHCIMLCLELIYQNLRQDISTTATNLSNSLNIDSMIVYIRQHIASQHSLTKKAIAAHFNISAHYVGEYFRKHTGISLREYINAYRLNIIEKRMKQSNLSFSQISQELGFTDESHFYKFIRIHTKKSPKQYKAALEQAVAVD